jgi:hypothetical protein
VGTVVLGNLLAGLIYGLIGALAGALVGRVLIDGAFARTFDAVGPLAVALPWLATFSIAVIVLLRRALGGR